MLAGCLLFICARFFDRSHHFRRRHVGFRQREHALEASFLAQCRNRVAGLLNQTGELPIGNLQALSHDPDLDPIIEVQPVAYGDGVAAAQCRFLFG